MILDILAEEDTVNSIVIVWDCKHLTLGHILKMTPSLLKRFNLCLVRNVITLTKHVIVSYSLYLI